MIKNILLILISSLSFCLEEITDHHSNGIPKTVKSYSSYGKLELVKEMGYYSNGIKQYEKNYAAGELKNTEWWDENGEKFPSISSLNMSISGKWIPIEILDTLLLEKNPDGLKIETHEFKNNIITVSYVGKDRARDYEYSFINEKGQNYLLVSRDYYKISFPSNDIMNVVGISIDKNDEFIEGGKAFDLVKINKIPSNIEDVKQLASLSKGKIKKYYDILSDKANSKEAEIQIKNITKSAEQYYIQEGELPSDCWETLETEGYLETNPNITNTWSFECLWKWSDEIGMIGSIIAKTSENNPAKEGFFIKYDILENEFSGTGKGY